MPLRWIKRDGLTVPLLSWAGSHQVAPRLDVVFQDQDE
jgi:hypothetical protein